MAYLVQITNTVFTVNVIEFYKCKYKANETIFEKFAQYQEELLKLLRVVNLIFFMSFLSMSAWSAFCSSKKRNHSKFVVVLSYQIFKESISLLVTSTSVALKGRLSLQKSSSRTVLRFVSLPFGHQLIFVSGWYLRYNLAESILSSYDCRSRTASSKVDEHATAPCAGYCLHCRFGRVVPNCRLPTLSARRHLPIGNQ